MIFPSHLSMTEYSLYSSVCINLRSRPAAVSTYNVVRKVYGTLLHRLRYLPYSSGAPFTVVRPTGKYCNVLLYPLSARRCNVLSTVQWSVRRCNVPSAVAMFQLLSRRPSSTAMQRTLSRCNATECNPVPLQHSRLPPLQRKLVSPCNTLVPHCNTTQLSLIAMQCIPLVSIAIRLPLQHSLVPCSATQLLSVAMVCPLQQSHFAIYPSAVPSAIAMVYPLQHSLVSCSATQLLSVAMVCPLQRSHFAIYPSAVATLSSPAVQRSSFQLQRSHQHLPLQCNATLPTPAATITTCLGRRRRRPLHAGHHPPVLITTAAASPASAYRRERAS